MKKFLLSAVVLATATMVNAQTTCNDLFISKYMRGKGNTKAIEFYNPTANPINLTSGMYSIERYKSAGASTAAQQIDAIMDDSLYLLGTVPAYGTWVLVNGQTAANSSSTSPEPDPAMKALANQLDKQYGTYGSNVGQPTYFKGNDCLVLRKNGAIIDVFGEVNTAVKTAWSTVAPYRGDIGMGKWITTGYVMERKASVKDGARVTNLTDITSFNPMAEYDTIPKLPSTSTRQDTLDIYGLFGQHTCDCKTQTTAVKELVKSNAIAIYPNPANGSFNVYATEGINTVEVYNTIGVLVANYKFNGATTALVNASDLTKGIYIIRTLTSFGKPLTNKITLN